MISRSSMRVFVVGFVGIAAILPFLMLLIGSFQSESTILQYGYSLIPRRSILGAYKFILSEPTKSFTSYLVTIFLTVAERASRSSFLHGSLCAVEKRRQYRNHWPSTFLHDVVQRRARAYYC